jgi:hypothetical protein
MTAYFSDLKIEDMAPEDAWQILSAADQDKDVDDIKRVRLA